MIVLTILAVIVIFSVLVLIHEFGHFVMARRAGIKVEEFGIGFPPRLFSKKKGETIYSVNAIPFGGFVRLFGEDAVEVEALHNKRSFICQSRWVRAKVIVAGVVMNFVLAVALLTVGFIFGIEPLLVTENDLSKHLNEGNVTMAPGVFVGKVSEAAEKLGIRPGDQILRIDDEPVTQTGQIVVFEKGKAAKDADLKLKSQDGSERDIHVPLTNKEHSYGIELKPFTEFPRLAVLEVKGDSASSRAGLLRGDVIISVNGLSITSSGQLDDVLATAGFAEYAVLRGERIISVKVTFDDARKVVISEVTRKSAAEEAGFHTGDAIVAMDSAVVTRPEDVLSLLKANRQKEMLYTVSRNGKLVEIKAKTDEKNILGIALSQLVSYRNSDLSLYRASLITSITEIKKVRYNPFRAFREAVSESVRLTGLTVKAFGRTLTSLVSKLTVPADIGGPVQIAYYTHAFVQQGFFALLRFTALLSLSLAVMNVLPIPALDGGRLLFILVEAVSGKRVNAKVEAFVHRIGFVLLLGLIILVTYSDVRKLFVD